MHRDCLVALTYFFVVVDASFEAPMYIVYYFMVRPMVAAKFSAIELPMEQVSISERHVIRSTQKFFM